MKRIALVVFLFSTTLTFAAFAQPHPPQHVPLRTQHPRPQTFQQQAPPIHPVAAPASLSSTPTDEHGKPVEVEEAPPPVNYFDTKIFNNKQPPIAALLFNFVLLVLIYYRYGKKPIADALKNRKLGIAGAIENAQKILREAKQRSKRYRAKLGDIATDAAANKQTLVSTGEGDAANLLRVADEKAERIARDATFLLSQEAKQTHADLLRETVEKAAKEAEALLRTNVSAQDQERLAEEFLKQLETDYAKGFAPS